MTAKHRPMTDLEKRRALGLAKCSFTPGSFDKRFARNIGQRAAVAHPTITEAGAACLERKCWTYRRQLPEALVPDAKPADPEPPAKVKIRLVELDAEIHDEPQADQVARAKLARAMRGKW